MMFDRLLSVQFEEASEGRDQEQQTWWDRDKGHEQRRCCGGASPASCCPKERVSWERSRTRIDPDADGRVLCLALRFDRGWGEHEQKLSGQRFTSIHSPTIENTERKVVNASPAGAACLDAAPGWLKLLAGPFSAHLTVRHMIPAEHATTPTHM
jgi:hypothetical protein